MPTAYTFHCPFCGYEFTRRTAAGNGFPCPVCDEPLTSMHVIYEKEGLPPRTSEEDDAALATLTGGNAFVQGAGVFFLLLGLFFLVLAGYAFYSLYEARTVIDVSIRTVETANDYIRFHLLYTYQAIGGGVTILLGIVILLTHHLFHSRIAKEVAKREAQLRETGTTSSRGGNTRDEAYRVIAYRMRALRTLRDAGTLSEEEYALRRAAIAGKGETPSARIATLNTLIQQGKLSQEEYEAKREEILSGI